MAWRLVTAMLATATKPLPVPAFHTKLNLTVNKLEEILFCFVTLSYISYITHSYLKIYS